MKHLRYMLLLFISLLMFGTVEAQTTSLTPAPTQTASLEQRLQQLESKVAGLEQSARNPATDIWNILSPIAGFTIAAVGLYFTQEYNKRQTQIARIQAIHDFMRELLSKEPLEREIALRLIATTDCQFALQIVDRIITDKNEAIKLKDLLKCNDTAT